MKRSFRIPLQAILAACVLATGVFAQQVKRPEFDVTGYVIDAQLAPGDNRLSATADVTFVPQEDTRNVSFELNGSLKVDSITRLGTRPAAPAPAGAPPARTPAAAAATPAPAGASPTFVQDQAGVSDPGPSVRGDFRD